MNYKVKAIKITTSTEGLGGVPADLYATTAEEILEGYYEGATVEVEVADRYLETKMDVSLTLATVPADKDDAELAEVKAEDDAREQIGRLLNDAFEAACSRA